MVYWLKAKVKFEPLEEYFLLLVFARIWSLWLTLRDDCCLESLLERALVDNLEDELAIFPIFREGPSLFWVCEDIRMHQSLSLLLCTFILQSYYH